jgi:hypothetical protein
MDIIVVLAVLALVVIPLWRIFTRAGLKPAYALLVLIPGLGFLIVAAVLAHAEWPALRRKENAS